MPTNVDYEELRKQREAPYFVQWVTEFDYNNHNLRVLGYCVKDKDWNTMFKHKEYEVCAKVCEMLNEGEVTNVRGT